MGAANKQALLFFYTIKGSVEGVLLFNKNIS
jgi:hypothetical protein